MRGCIILAILAAGCRVVSGVRSAPPPRPIEPVPLSRIADYEPAWSPDGNHLAFVSNRNGPLKIYTIRVDGADLKQLTHGPDEDDAPSWSPDGSRIAFVATRDGNQEIYVMNADGSEQMRLT